MCLLSFDPPHRILSKKINCQRFVSFACWHILGQQLAESGFYQVASVHEHFGDWLSLPISKFCHLPIFLLTWVNIAKTVHTFRDMVIRGGAAQVLVAAIPGRKTLKAARTAPFAA